MFLLENLLPSIKKVLAYKLNIRVAIEIEKKIVKNRFEHGCQVHHETRMKHNN